VKLTRVIAIAVIAASSGLGFAQAQSISSVQAPAEFPPASFKGRQYVDSQGCVFVRAGIDGNVSWIPRVSRKRKVICGFQPSIAGGGTTIAAAPKQAAEPVQITVAEPAAVKPAAKPAMKPAAKPAAKPVVAKRVVKPVAIQPVQKPIIIAQPQTKVVQLPKRTVIVTQPATNTLKPTTVLVKPLAQPTLKATSKTVTIAAAKAAPQPKTMAPRQSACRGASPLSSQYLNSTGGLAVRCGPQDTSHVSMTNGGNARSVVNIAPAITTYAQTSGYTQPVPLKRATSAPTTVVKVPSGSTRFVRENIYNNQVASTKGVYIPAGYKAAWEDDRLNTKRAHQTYNGKAQMELRWTNTVPRRLIVADTGQDAAYLFPGLQYPNTSYDQQLIAGVSASANGATAAQTLHRSKANKTRETMQAKPANRATTQATISTRSAAAQPQAKVITQTRARTVSHRYVQAGMFGDMGNAQRAAQRLANSGLSAKLGKRKQNGKTYGVVVAGPFTSQGQLNAALQKVRGMGFGDAFLRK